MRAALAVLGVLFAAGSAGAADEHLKAASGPFQLRVLKEIYAVIPFDPPRFSLARESTVEVLLDGAGPATAQCSRSVMFQVIAGQSAAGSIAVSLCPEHLDRLRVAAPTAQRTLAMLQGPRQGGPDASADAMRKAGLFYDRATVAAGGELHYFPVIVIGHGVDLVLTAMLLTDRQAVVVRGTLGAIAQRVHAAFP